MGQALTVPVYCYKYPSEIVLADFWRFVFLLLMMCTHSQKLSFNLEKALVLSESCVFVQRASPRIAFNPGSQNLKIRKRSCLAGRRTSFL